MSAQRLRTYLEHVREAAQQACAYVEGFDEMEFRADKRTQQAVMMNLIVLGEAATQLLKNHSTFLARHPEVPWTSMKGMRNRMAHGYFEINLTVVWETVRTALPSLLSQLPPILEAAALEAPGDNEPR